MYGCASKMVSSQAFTTLSTLGTFPSLVLALVSLACLFTFGQLLLGVTDILRLRFTRVVFETKKGLSKLIPSRVEKMLAWVPDRFIDIGDPFERGLKRIGSQRDLFEDSLARLRLADASVTRARSQVWAAAGYLQQNANYGHADRFNTLAIFSFCIATISSLSSVLSAFAAFIMASAPLGAWAFALAVTAFFFYHRALQFHQFFATTVASGFMAHQAGERLAQLQLVEVPRDSKVG